MDEASVSKDELFPQIKQITEITNTEKCGELCGMLFLEAINSYLLVSANGDVWLMNADLILDTDASAHFSPSGKLFYNQNFGSLIIADGNGYLGFRRSFDKTFHLASMQTKLSDKETSVEITYNEAVAWKTHSSQVVEKLKLGDRKYLQQFFQQIDAELAHPHFNQNRSIIININGSELLSELLHLTNIATTSDFYNIPVFPYAFYLLERLHLALFPKNPYGQKMGADRDSSYFNVEAARLQTFTSWPHMEYKSAIPSQMAEAGFYFDPKELGDDRVYCFDCSVCLINWEPDDHPRQEHERHSQKKCSFIHGTSSNKNVPFSLTMANLAPINWTSFLPSKETMDVDKLIYGSMTPNSQWFGMCANYTNGRNPSVILFHLDNVVQNPYIMTVDHLDCYVSSKLCPYTATNEGDKRVRWVDDSADTQRSTATSKNTSATKQAFTKITSLCTVGVKPSFDTIKSQSNTQQKIVGALFVGVCVDYTLLQHTTESSEPPEITALNSVNDSLMSDSCPQIESMKETKAKWRPFFFIYNIVEFVPTFSSRRSETIFDVTDESQCQTDSVVIVPPLPFSQLDDPFAMEIESSADALFASCVTDRKEAQLPSTSQGNKIISTIVMQCLQPPSELSSAEFQIDVIVPTEFIVLVGVNRTANQNSEAGFTSALVAYPRMDFVNMIHEESVRNFKFDFGAIEQIVLMPIEYAIYLKDSDSKNRYDESSTMVLGYLLVRFSTDVLILLDLDSGQYKRICENKWVKNATVGLEGIVNVLNDDGSISSFEIKQPIIRTLNDDDEELAFSALSKLCISGEFDEELRKNLSQTLMPSVERILDTIKSTKMLDKLSMESLSELWKLVSTVSELLPESRDDLNSVTSVNNSDVLPLFGKHYMLKLRKMSSNISQFHQLLFGFKMTAPLNWVEAPQKTKRLGEYSNYSATSNSPAQERSYTYTTNRSWTLTQKVDQPHPSSTYVFEFSIDPSMPLALINFYIRYKESMGSPDCTFSIFHAGCETTEKILRTSDQQLPTNLIPPHSAQTQLSKLSENPDLVKEHATLIFGPVHISDFADLSSQRFSLIQITQHFLLNAVASAALSNGAFPTGWMNRQQNFYILIESISKNSPQQLAYCRTSSVALYKTLDGTVEGNLKRTYASTAKNSPSAVKSLFSHGVESYQIQTSSFGKKKPDKKHLASHYKDLKKFVPVNSNEPVNIDPRRQSAFDWISELSVTLFPSDSQRIARHKLRKMILIKRNKAHEDLISIAIGGLNNADSKRKADIFLSQFQALDISNWLIAELCLMLNTPFAKNDSSTILNNLLSFTSSKLSAIIRNGYIYSETRTLSHKWTIFFSSLLLHPTVQNNISVEVLNEFLKSAFSELNEFIKNLYLIENSGSMRWLVVFISILFKASLIDKLHIKRDHIDNVIHELLRTCINVVETIGIEWKYKWQNSLHAKLAQEQKLSGLVLDQYMFDYPTQLLYLKANIEIEPQSNTRKDGKSKKYLHQHSFDTAPSPFVPYSFTIPPQPSITDYPNYFWTYGSTASSTSVPYTPPSSTYIICPHHAQPFGTHPMQQTMADSLVTQGFHPALSTANQSSTTAPYVGFAQIPTLVQPIFTQIPPFYEMDSSSNNAMSESACHNQSLLGSNSKDPAITVGMATKISASFCSGQAIDELSWDELLYKKELTLCLGDKNIGTNAAQSNNKWASLLAPPGWPHPHTQQFASTNGWGQVSASPPQDPTPNAAQNGSDVSSCTFVDSNKVTLDMQCLLEVQPLSFVCLYGTDHMYIMNANNKELLASESQKNASKQIQTESENLLEATSRRLKVLDEIVSDTAVISKKDKLPCESVDELLASESQSASTYGIPTTPKTTPFLTPNPLSPINSQSDLTGINIDAQEMPLERMFTKTEKDTVSNEGADLKGEGIKISRQFFRTPEPISLIIDRMTAGSKKFVVLDFGMPVLITDLILPSSEFASSVCMDAWLEGEEENSLRVLQSSVIGRKSIILNDMHPPVLSRYIKLTYTIRELQDRPRNIALGKFFGTRFFSKYQIYGCKNLTKLEKTDNHEAYLPQLVSLYERLHCEFIHRTRKLKDSLKCANSSPLLDLKKDYYECFNVRKELNVIRALIQRLQPDSNKPDDNWRSCIPDKLQSISNALFVIMFNHFFLFDVRSKMRSLIDSDPFSVIQVSPFSTLFNLEHAVKYFDYFCKDSLPMLRIHCCSLLFHLGSNETWWSSFFPTLLKKYFGFTFLQGSKKNNDSLFLCLTVLCNESVKYTHLQSEIIQKLFDFLVEQLPSDDLNKIDIPLISWTLLLISSAFDIIVSKKRRNNRWSFLAGEFGLPVDARAGFPNEKQLAKQSSHKHCPTKYSATTMPSLITKQLLQSKNYYKKLTDQFEKMKQNQTISQAKIEKLKNRLQSLQSLQAIYSTKDSKNPPSFVHQLQPSSSSANFTSGYVVPSSSSKNPFTPAEHPKLRNDEPALIPGKVRQYGVKLKIPTSLSFKLVKKLVKLLCHSHSLVKMHLHTSLLILKVIANICVHGSLLTIPLSAALDVASMRSLLALTFRERDYWLRHAVLSLFLDVSESEVRAISKQQIASTQIEVHPSVVKERKEMIAGVDIPSTSEVEAKRPKNDEELPTCSLIDVEMTSPEELNKSTCLADITPEHSEHCDLKSIERSISTEFNPQISLPNMQLQFDVECQMISVNCSIQPAAGLIESGAESTPSFDSYTRCTKIDRLNEIISRYYLRKLDILPCRSNSIYSLTDTSDVSLIQFITKETAKCYRMVLDVIHSMFDLLEAGEFNLGFVQNLFYFYWNYQANFLTFLKSKGNNIVEKSNLFAAPQIAPEAIKSLLNFSIKYRDMDEQLWTYVFELLCTSAKNDQTLIETLLESNLLEQLFGKLSSSALLSQRIQDLEEKTTHSFGPTLSQKVEEFIEIIVAKAPSKKTMKSVITIVISLLQKTISDGCQNELDVLLKISKVLGLNTKAFGKNTDPSNVAKLFALVQLLSREMFTNLKNNETGAIHSRQKLYDVYPQTSKSSDFCPSGSSTSSSGSHQMNVCLSNNSMPKQFGKISHNSSSMPMNPLELIGVKTSTSKVPERKHGTCSFKPYKSFTTGKKTPSILYKEFEESTAPSNAFIQSSYFDDIAQTFEPEEIEFEPEDLDKDFSDEIYDVTPMQDIYWHSSSVPFGNESKKAASNIGNGVVHSSKFETLLCYLLKMICQLISERDIIRISDEDDLVIKMIKEHLDAFSNMLYCLLLCELPTDDCLDSLSIENWKCVSLGDLILYLMLTVFKAVENNEKCSRKLIEHLLVYIDSEHGMTLSNDGAVRLNDFDMMTRKDKISSPVAFVLLKLLQNPQQKELFLELGGSFVAKQLQDSIQTAQEQTKVAWFTNLSFSALHHQINSISKQISGSGVRTPAPISSNASISTEDPQQLYNFAPICSISSPSTSAHHLQSLTIANPPHRRSRMPSWTYVYENTQEWLELTLTLPYPVMLFQVIIKPHLPTLLNAPSSVQLELNSSSHWSVVKCQETFGRACICINTSTYKNPVVAVRIHLRRPLESNSIGLVQIMLNGTTRLSDSQMSMLLQEKTKALIYWLTLFDQISFHTQADNSAFFPQLPQLLIQLFLNNPNPSDERLNHLLNRVLLNMHKTIVAHSSSESVVYLIMQYINENGAVNDNLHPQLAELLFSLCTTYAQENFYNAELSPSIETILVSQNRLIEGIAQLLEQSDILSIGSVQSDFALAETLLDDKNIQNRLNTISLILWTTSCILWRNLDTGATKFATIQLCSEHSPKMINHLISLSLSLMNTSQGKIDREENLLLTTCKRLKKAACWLLCVFVRVTPQIINQIFEFYAQNQIDNAHPQEPEFVPDVLYSLGQICQSTKAVSQLRSNGYLDRWVQRATELCRNAFLKPDEFKFDELVAIIDCLKNLCSIYEVCTFLEEYSGSNLIQTLLHLIVDVNFNKPKNGTSKSLLTNIQLIQLQISVIKLIKKCLSIGGKHRILVAQILCDLLYQSEDLDSNHSLLLMIHQLVLDDEQITVQFTKVRSISVNNEKRELGQMAHPIFGCCQTSVTCELSIHTPFRELCPKFVDARKSKGQEKALQNKRFMTPWANYSQDEATDNTWLDAPWMHIEGYYKMIKRRSNKRQTENSDSSPKTRLFCEAYSRYKCLQKDYSIATLIQKLLGTSGNPFKGGFMFLQLTLRACGADKTDIVLTSSSPSKEVPKSQLSTLEHFASVGGLLELSKRYYIYHHALTRLFNSCDILTQDLSRISKGVRTGLQLFKANKTNYLTQQTNLYQSLLENINNTAPNPQQTFVSDGNTVCLTYPTMNSNLIEVDQPANFVGSLELFQDNPDSYGVSITDPVPYYGQNSTTNFTTGLSPKSSTTALSFDGSHIIPLFGLFLRLDSYAELMIQTDRLKAKKLLCMALDIKPIEHSMSEFLANLCPMDIKEKAPQEASSTDPSAKYRNFPSVLRNYNEVSNSEAADDAEELTLFPLIILKCLYEKYCPSKIGLEKATSIRQNSVEYGIVDSLIVCLNHFTHNDGAVDQSKTENAETTIQLIGEVLKASERLEQLRVSLAQLQQTKVEQDSLMAEMPIPTTNFSANASAVTTATSQVGNQTSKSSTTQTKSSGEWGKPTAAASSTATTQESSFWAKGTGFGSGSTQQQWNVNEHLSRRRQNENHIAHLLNVLSAYIRPDLNVQKERPPQVSSPLLPFVSEESIVPSTSGLTSSSSEEKGEGGNQGAAEIDENIVLSENFVHLLQHSCTCKIVQSYLVNDSVLDISKHVVVFDAIISFIAALARTPDIKIKKNREVNAVDMSTPETGQSLPLAEQTQTQIDVLGTLLTPMCDDQHQIDLSQRRKAIVDLLEKLTTLRKNIQIYLNKIEKSKPSPSFTSSKKRRDKKRHIQFDIDILEKTENSFASTSQSLPSPSDSGVNEDEGLDKLLWLIIDACEAIQKKVDLFEVPLDHSKGANNVPIAHSSLSEAIASRENSYCGAMKPLQFETLPFYEENGTKLDVSYHYSSMLASAGSAASSHKRTRRLAQEIVSLNSSLPLSLSSSVFIRASEERLDAMKVLITGPSDTPYANGCFEFDIYFPADYPNTPMLVNLETTGNRSVRFNPNLYDDGKVCLSILNTWRGRPEERWNSETSSLLQVIVSIQSLILVNDPYFNEPGYERWRNTPNGQQASREYDANIRQMCVRWAMIETLKHPPKTFAEVVQRHFWLKRDEICEQIEGWIEETQSYITNKVSSSKTLPAYLAGLKKQYELLKEEFANMQCPKGIMPDHFISTRFPLPNLPDTGKLDDAHHQIDGDKNE